MKVAIREISKDSWRNSYFQIKGKAFRKRLHLSWRSNEKPALDILRQRGKRRHSGGGKTEVWKDMEAGKRKSDPGVVNSLVWWTQKEFLGWSESESWIHVWIRPWRTLNTCLTTSFMKRWGAFESLSKVEASKHRLPPIEINTMPYSCILSRGVLISVCLRYCGGFYCIQIFTIWSSKPGETRPLRHLPLRKLPEHRGTISARGTCHT